MAFSKPPDISKLFFFYYYLNHMHVSVPQHQLSYCCALLKNILTMNRNEEYFSNYFFCNASGSQRDRRWMEEQKKGRIPKEARMKTSTSE